MYRTLTALALAFACALPAATATAASPSAKRDVCGWEGYSYAGYHSPVNAYAVTGRLGLRSASQVSSGHVAAWIGVGGSGLGPGGADEWVQVGIAGFPDGHSELYYEYLTPSMRKPRYVTLQPMRPGEAHDLAVQERPSQPGAWRIWVDGVRAGESIVLPGSHGAWRPMATAESWDGGIRTCNRFDYDFSNLAVSTRFGGGWVPFSLVDPIRSPGYVLGTRGSGFTASASS